MNSYTKQPWRKGDQGLALPTEEVPCSDCRGRGYFWSNNGPAPRQESCDECSGSGFNYIEVEI